MGKRENAFSFQEDAFFAKAENTMGYGVYFSLCPSSILCV
jgi:hypothetical protein